MRHTVGKWVLAIGMASLGGLACVFYIPEDDAPCPCGPGWTCCEEQHLCVPEGEPCVSDEDAEPPPPDAAPGPDAYVPPGCWLPCDRPANGTNSVCGQIRDGETNAPVAVAETTGADCEALPLAEREGPCRLQLAFYDALAFAQNPSGTSPLPVGQLVVNDCGYFAARDIPTPALGFLAVSVDDAAESGTDQYVLSSTFFPVAPSETVSGMSGLAVRKASDEAWTSTAGHPFGSTTFVQKGVICAVFRHQGEPVSGVQVTRDASGTIPADDYYFADSQPESRSVVDLALHRTGENGAALVINSPLVDHSAVGGLPAGCAWPGQLAKSVPGVANFVSLETIDELTGEPCE